MVRMTGGQAVVEALKAHDVRAVFGMPGVHNLALYDAFLDAPEIRHIVVRHEQGAGFAADGYARATGHPGVAVTTAGPGATNALTAVAEAWSDSSPVVLIASHIESPYVEQERGFGHELRGQLDMFQTATRFRARPMHVGEVGPSIAEAFAQAQSGRPRPVVVQIPQDVLNDSADVDPVEPLPLVRQAGEPAIIGAAAKMLAGARSVAIFAGVGVHRSGAHEELLNLAELLDAPVFTTSQGKGAIPEDHPLAVGNRWTGEPELIKQLGEADVLLAVGTRLGATDTGQWKLELPSTIIHVDADSDELNRNIPAEIGIAGDAKIVLGQLLRELDGHSPDGHANRQTGLPELRQRLDAAAATAWPEPMQLLSDLRAGLERDAIVFCDSLIEYWAARHFPVYAPRSIHLPWTYGTLGSSLPMAIGAKIAFPERQVVTLCGDGALMFTLPELATAVQAGANVVIVVCNDRGFGAMRMHQRRRFGRFIASDLATPDFVTVAEAFGARGLRANSPYELGPALATALADSRPVLIEVPLALDIPWR